MHAGDQKSHYAFAYPCWQSHAVWSTTHEAAGSASSMHQPPRRTCFANVLQLAYLANLATGLDGGDL